MQKVIAFVKKHSILFGILAVTLVIAIPVVFFAASFNSHVTVEAGTKFQTASLWKTGIKPTVIVEDNVNTETLGTQEYVAKVFGIPVKITVEVCDTTAPKASVKNIVINYGESCKPEDFIVNCRDSSEVKYEFVNEPDCSKTGTQVVSLRITDGENNSTTTTVKLTVMGVLLDYIMELGGEIPSASDFVLDETITAEYVTEPDEESFSELGKYDVPVLFNGTEETVSIWVVDKTSPVVEVTDKVAYLNREIGAEAFVTSVSDASETTISYKTEPDFSTEGTQKLTISVRDSAGNVTEKEVELTVKKDTTAPSINTSYIRATLNESISYKKNINVSDNCDSSAELILDIDNSGVNLSAVGTYIVYCTATDTSGNVAKKDITIEVVETVTSGHTQAEIDKLCDELLAKITNDSMSLDDKAYAIYKWTRNSIAYLNNSPKGDWLDGAYNGLVKKQGDCYTYAATAKALLERIGLEPIVIKKEITAYTNSNNHYWLLVDLGNGYYHYDPTRRADGTWFYMWTDAQLKEYSDNHWGSHNFTRAKYPEIQ